MNAVQELLTHLDRMRAQHRAGIVPPNGEIDQLWDLVADVRGAIATGDIQFRPSHVQSNQLPTVQLSIELKDAAGQLFSRQILPLSSEVLAR